jgi:hypothetical protein
MTTFLCTSRFKKYDIEEEKQKHKNDLANLIRYKKNVRHIRNIINPIDVGIIIRLSLVLLRSYNCTLPIRKVT